MKKKNLTTATSTNIPAYSTIATIFSRAFYPACLSGNPSSAPGSNIAWQQQHLQKPPD